MPDRTEIARLYTAATAAASDDAAAAVAPHLAAEVEVAGAFGRARGVEATLALLHNPAVATLSTHASWSEPVTTDDAVELEARLPPPAPVGGLRYRIAFDDADRIVRVEQDQFPPAPIPAAPLVLTPAIKESIANAVANHSPMIVVHVDRSGQPRMSLRGSTHVHSDDQLAVWLRDLRGGLASAVAANPRLTLWLHDGQGAMWYEFLGRGHIDPTPAVRDRVWDNTIPAEQDRDWRRRGGALVIDLDEVRGFGFRGRIHLARDAD
jgi:hypothetical protein